MVNRTSWAAWLVLAAVCAGCGQNMGYIVKPVAMEEGMTETVVQTDGGLFLSDKIAILDVSGLLMNQRETGLFSEHENPVNEFVEKVAAAQEDDDVKAVVVRINSPGGTVTAADIMHNRLMEFRKARKVPVVCIIEDLGASGGYYIACGGDTIMAHPTAVVGSIGVIAQTFSLAGTMKLIGIDAKAITTGKYKDMASPFKPLDVDDQAILKGMIDQFYQRFLQVVGEGRPNLTAGKIKELADGRVYSAQQAKDNGLIDSLGYMDDAIALAKKKAGLTKAKVVMYHRPWGTRENVYSASPAPQPQMNLLNINVPGMMNVSQPQFLYLWTGKN